jgi:tetratricopeptide (TPR) repeat protein
MKRLLAIAIAWGLAATPVSASGEGGTESPFALGAGARDLALGGAAMATADPATAPFWNPSRLAAAERFSLSGFHSRLYDADVAYQYLGLVVPTLDAGTFGLGVFRLGVDGIEETDASGLLLGQIKDSRLGFYLAYARSLSSLDVGAAASLEQHSLGDYSTTSSPGIDLSVSRRLTPRSQFLREATFAVHLRNVIRPSLKLVDKSVDYPAAAEGAVSVELARAGKPHRLMLSASAAKTDGVDPVVALGAEYRFRDLAALRAGVRAGKAAFGAGLQYSPVAFDYALVDRDFGSLHTFTLTTSFGSPTSERRQRRADQREAEFNRLMSERLAARNRAQADELIREGQRLLDMGEPARAFDQFDRALFMGRSSGGDTAAALALWAATRQRMEAAASTARYRGALDSAQARRAAGDYLAARYFARLAEAERPSSPEAQTVVRQADSALAQVAEREMMIKSRLLAVDSLVSYGQIEAAHRAAGALAEIAGDDPAVRAALRRTRFEQLRSRASQAYAAHSYDAALAVLDSALSLFPGHRVCLDMQASVRRAQSEEHRTQQVVLPASEPRALSPELEEEVRSLYESGRRAFEEGLLSEAISRWEKVELLAPGYEAVRSYLVNAYKFVGVEYYGQNRPEDAVAAWEKAARLDPGNAEIASYIRRTETEMRKLKELSYDN